MVWENSFHFLVWGGLVMLKMGLFKVIFSLSIVHGKHDATPLNSNFIRHLEAHATVNKNRTSTENLMAIFATIK